MDKIRLLLVDDQTLFVESLHLVMRTRARDIKVVGVAYDGETAVKLALAEKPDVILMDIRMPGMDGVECLRIVKEKLPAAKVLMLTTFMDDEYITEALRLGAVGYLLKNMPPAELIAAVRTVYSGGVIISPQVASKLMAKISPAEHDQKVNIEVKEVTEKPPANDSLNKLSSREREILKLVADGNNNKEIASRLYIAEQTVKNQVSMIFAKLGVHNRAQAGRVVHEEQLKNSQ